jgi:oligosaccharide repeat unit polymerase
MANYIKELNHHNNYGVNYRLSIMPILRGILLFFLILALLRNILYYYNIIEVPEIFKFSWQILITIILEVTFLLLNKRVYKLGFAFILYTYTMLTHFGFVCAMLFDNTLITLKSEVSMAFYFDPNMIDALLISSIVIECFALAISYFSSKRRIYINNSKENNISSPKNPQEITPWYLYVVLSIQVVIFLYLLYITFVYGLLSISYGVRWDLINSVPFYGDTIVLYALTFALVLIVGNKNIKAFSFCVYSLTALVHFALGNRGEVLYSAIICFAIYYLQKKMIKKWWIILGSLVVILIPNIRYIRQMDFNKISFSMFDSLLETSAELGWQISPFTYIVNDLENGSHAYGGTYLLYFYDFIARKIFFLPQVTSDFNPNRIVDLMPYDGMGFTMIAEVFYNFGLIGAILSYIILARFLTYAEYRVWNESGAIHTRVFCAMLVIEFINLTRNSSSTLPLYLAYITLLWLPIYISTSRKRVDKRKNII